MPFFNHLSILVLSLLISNANHKTNRLDTEIVNQSVDFILSHDDLLCRNLEEHRKDYSLWVQLGVYKKADALDAIQSGENFRFLALIQAFDYSDEEKNQFLEIATRNPLASKRGIPWLLICYGARFEDRSAALSFAKAVGLESRRSRLEALVASLPDFHAVAEGEAFYRKDLPAPIFLSVHDYIEPSLIATAKERLEAATQGDFATFYKIVRPSQIDSIQREGLDPAYGGKSGASEASASFAYLATLDSGKMFVGTTIGECLAYFRELAENRQVYLLKLNFPLKDFADYRMSFGGRSGGWYFQGNVLPAEYMEFSIIHEKDLENLEQNQLRWNKLSFIGVPKPGNQ